MKWMVLCAGLALACAACGGDDASNNGIGCVTGMTAACDCELGGLGAKTCVSPQKGYGICDCRPAQGQGTAGTLSTAGTTAGVLATAGTNGGTAGLDNGIAGTVAGTSSTAGDGSTLADAGGAGTVASTEGAYVACDAGSNTCPNGMMCVHPGEGVDQQPGPMMCTPACTPPSIGNPSPTNDCPAAASGNAAAMCSVIESFCYLDCGTGTCPDGMTCEALPVGPQTVMVCNYQ